MIEYPKQLIISNPSSTSVIGVEKLLEISEKQVLTRSEPYIHPFRTILTPNNPVSMAINEFTSVYRPYNPGPGYTSNSVLIGSSIALNTGSNKIIGQITDDDGDRVRVSIPFYNGDIWLDKKKLSQ